MAQSPAHRFGQFIGELLEEMVRAPLEKIAAKHGLYLDYKHPRPARGNKRKVAWTDLKGNQHDLDFVLEFGGSETTIGSPKAFIESAWRRYTKHSRNKAQEIQGAVSVLAETYSKFNPFLGVILAGVFTKGSIQELRSHGFSIVYCQYEIVMEAFNHVGIDARFDENSPDDIVLAKVTACQLLSTTDRNRIVRKLTSLVKSELKTFVEDLEKCLNRQIERILIASLHGPTIEVNDIAQAIERITNYDETKPADGFVRYEIDIRYSNNDHINGTFEDKLRAIQFLNHIV
ncbi:MAG: hypothetical protein WEB58_20805 [Planctomycetaceae bacterium]